MTTRVILGTSTDVCRIVINDRSRVSRMEAFMTGMAAQCPLAGHPLTSGREDDCHFASLKTS